MIPEAKLVKKTILLRKLALPKETLETKNSLLRWLALSLGLINENESRTKVLDVLDACFYFIFHEEKPFSAKEIFYYLRKNNISITERLVRYHLKRLEQIGLLEHKKGKYSASLAPGSETFALENSIKYVISRELEEYFSLLSIAFKNLREKYK